MAFTIYDKGRIFPVNIKGLIQFVDYFNNNRTICSGKKKENFNGVVFNIIFANVIIVQVAFYGNILIALAAR